MVLRDLNTTMNKLLVPLITFFTGDNLTFRRCLSRSFLATVSSALLLGAATTQAATLTVTSSGDSGAGTLRQAILDASPSGGDTINFAVTGVITLTSGELAIAKNLTITGPGANVLTVRRNPAGGAPEFRIFFIGNNSHVTISNLTIRNGRDYNSGAILNDGATLTVNNCVFTANSGGGYGGGGIMSDGSNANARLAVNNSVFDGNSSDFMGGAILNFSTSHSANLTVSNCIFTNNSAENGGGMVNYVGFDGAVTATVNDTTFTGNSAALGRGGAIHNDSVAGSATMRVSNCTITNNSANFYGGGVANSGRSLEISNCTLTGNSAAGSGGGIYTEYGGAEVHISNCTLSGNSADFHGSGIYTQPEASVAITNTILKTGASGENLYGGIISHGHNLSNDAAGGDNSHGPGGLLNQPGDIRNTDPQIGPLADNGGLTKTMALLPNSPAINAGNDAVAPPRDQRGYLRSGTSDIGAFEFGGIIPAALGNISTRAFVQTGDNVMIGGFIVQGAGPKRVIIRAIGPELSQYGVPDPLANPTLELHDRTGALIGSNDDWQHTIIGGVITRSQVADIKNSGHAPTNPFESAIIADLPPGNYTAIVRGINDTTGVALVEVYDLGNDASSILGNISTRSFVQTGDNVMIGGFIVQGTGAKRVIIRAIGPELSQFGVPDPLANPRLELHNAAGALIGSNDDWQHTIIGGVITRSQVADIQNSGHAPTAPTESAIIAELPPGNYTAIVRGVNNTTGVALVEVYDLD